MINTEEHVVRPRGTVEYRFHDGKLEWRNLADDEQNWIESTYSVELVEQLYFLVHPGPVRCIVLTAQHLADMRNAAQTVRNVSVTDWARGLAQRLEALAADAERTGVQS